jgi:hypothetical protein
MRRFMAAGLLAAWLLCTVPGLAAAAPDDYDETQSHPLRVAAYLLNPIGFTLEWVVFRPLHYLVSRPSLEPVFGHHRHAEIRVY